MALIDIVKFDGLASRDWLVYKHYKEDLTTATQLVVNEGQAAAFVKGGAICDIFGPGTHTLTTANIPILNKLINLPFGKESPFKAEIYYINTATKLDLHWGTTDPIPLIDPKYRVRLRIRAFGQAGLKVSNIEHFIKEIIGTMSAAEVVSYNKVVDYFKGILVSKIKSSIADIIINDGISALEISARLDDISEKIEGELSADFAEYGIRLINLRIQSINFPDDDFEQINKILEDRAAFDIMGDSRYATMRTFDVYEGAANNQNGVAGAFVAGGMGLGVGMNLASNIPNPNAQPSAKTINCAKCGALLSEGYRFCASCGNSVVYNEKICTNCSSKIAADSRFCPSCGTKVDKTVCECGKEISAGTNFCPNCGKKVN